MHIRPCEKVNIIVVKPGKALSIGPGTAENRTFQGSLSTIHIICKLNNGVIHGTLSLGNLAFIYKCV